MTRDSAAKLHKNEAVQVSAVGLAYEGTVVAVLENGDFSIKVTLVQENTGNHRIFANQIRRVHYRFINERTKRS